MTTPDSATVTDHTRQWLEKAVIGLNLCPFAKAPHVKNLVRISVSQARHLDGFLEDLDRELQLLGDTPADELETTLLVHPTLFPDFDTFNQMLDIADAAVVDNGLEGIVQIAPFHPDFQFEGTDSDDIGNYTNRSPYPPYTSSAKTASPKPHKPSPTPPPFSSATSPCSKKWDTKAGTSSIFPAARLITAKPKHPNKISNKTT